EMSAADHDGMMTALTELQKHEHDRLVEALDSDRYSRLLSDWRSFLEQRASSSSGTENASATLAAVVCRRAWRLSRRIATGAKALDDQTPAEQIHSLRVHAKKLRYLIDVAPGFDDSPDLASVLNSLKRLQRVLGDFNDADVQERRLLDCGSAFGA